MNELQETVDTIIELDEPEALLRTLRKAAGKQKGKRWEALTSVLDEAETRLDAILNANSSTKAQTAGPDFTKPAEPQPEADTQPDMA